MSGAVLITGATGLVGGELLCRVLEETDRPVVALVRASDAAGAWRRTREALTARYGDEACGADRVRAVAADLSDPGAWDAELLEALEDVTDVVHAAASVDFGLDEPTARAINVQGAARVARLVRSLPAVERFVHVSTAYVAGRHAGTFAEADGDLGQQHRNAYERTKLEAERRLRDEFADLPLAIARPSIVVGERPSGWTTAFNVVYGPLRLFASGAVTEAPAPPDGLLDIVPVDYVTAGLAALLDAPAPDRGAPPVLHLVAGEHAVTTTELAALAADAFDRPPPRLTGDLGRPLPAGLAALAPYFDVRVRFDDRNARALLDGRDEPPPVLAEYFDRLAAYARATHWGRKAMTRAAARELALAGA